MSTESWLQFALDASLDKYETYLGMQGFKFAENFGERGAIYVSSEGQYVVVPTTKEIDDIEMRLAKLVGDLSRFLDYDREKIARSISSIGFDALKVKTGIGNSSISVDLDDALDTLHNSYALIDYSAVFATSKKPVLYVRGRRSKKVSQYLDAVRMGQTEPGSFVLTLLLPTQRADRLLEKESENLGIGQRVSNALANGLEASKSFSTETGAPKIAFPANFATALAEIVALSPKVEINLHQSSSREIHRVAFERRDEEGLREIADKLAPRVETWTRKVRGTVFGVIEPRGQRSGSVVLETLIGDDLKNLRIPFVRSERQIVIEALDKKAELALEVEGEIVKSAGGRYTMEKPQNFQCVQRGSLT